MSVEPGQILVGKYRVERVLGQGGMGVVVQATHLELDERVAVKFLLPEYAKQAEAAARFLREAKAAVKIKSEHVARVIDVGKLETGAPYMVMEFLSGRDLSAVLESRGRLPIEDAVEYILQAGEAIAEAHAAGIVHRDLKPANLFLTQRADGSSVIKVLDFGISKVTVPSDSGPDMSLTKTSAMMGSPLYMSPEQMRSARDVDPRTDIWSLGAILYELVTGAPPFSADSLPELCARILGDPLRPAREVRADVPPGLDAAITRCLEKQPSARHPSVAELAIAIVPFGPKRARVSVERISKVMSAAGLSASQMDVERLATQRPPPGARTLAAWGQTAPGGGHDRRVTIVATVAATVLFIGIGAGAFVWSQSREKSIASEPEHRPAAAASIATAAAPPIPEPVATPPPPASAASTPVIIPAPAPAAPPEPKAAAAQKPRPRPAPAAKPPAKPAPAAPARAPASRAEMFGDRN